MPSPLEERLFTILKRLEQTSERLAQQAENTSSVELTKVFARLYNFTLKQTKRERVMMKRLEALEAMMLKLLRSNSALADKLENADVNFNRAIARDFTLTKH